MSQIFYLNDLMADAPTDGVDVQKEFENTMLQYAKIRNEPLLDIEKYVVIGNEVSKIMIGGKSLKELIKGVEDNDLRKVCYGYFCLRDNTNLLDYNYQDADFNDTVLEEILDMTFHNGKSALYTAMASLKSWLLLSFPIEKEWKNPIVTLDDKNKYKLNNFYGSNRYCIVDKILQGQETSEAYLVRFTHRLDNFTIEYSDDFKDYFLKMQVEELRNMTLRLNLAYSRNLITLNKEDERLYRLCSCTGVSNMFELKSSHDLGIRFYLKKKDESHLIFGGVGRKSNYKGLQQNNDMIRAYRTIEKYEKEK